VVVVNIGRLQSIFYKQAPPTLLPWIPPKLLL